jgi:hypothetical protein
MVDDSILFGHNTSSTTYERMMDPMLLDAGLTDLRCDTKGGSSTPLSSISTLSVVNHHPFIEVITILMLLRSEAEQRVGYELIKALGDFKQLTVPPLSPHTQLITSSVEKSTLNRLVDNRSFSHHQRIKIKSQKPVVKIVCDMLIKKWVFVKRDNQLSVLTEVARLLETMRLPP